MDARLILALGCLWAAPALAQGFDQSHQGYPDIRDWTLNDFRSSSPR
ncbi:MAG: hypothetical protein O2979_11345 [Proteobacteria bacterium]|nr:hypothetical protein [Pseudomonadota bacterium]